MPFRFDPKSQKVVDDHSTAKTGSDSPAHNGPGSSHGQLLPPPGTSHSKIPAGQMDKSRQRTALGQAIEGRDLWPIMQRAFIITGLIVIVLTLVIYAVSQQFKFNKDKQTKAGGSESEAALTLPKGKKLTPLAMHQFLMKLAARAVDESNHQAAARLYAHAAEEARLGGAALNKQYIDALFAQGEVYQYNLSDSARAIPLFEKVLKAQQADSTTKPIKIASTYNDLANSLSADNDAVRARIATLYQKAITLAKSASDNKGHANYCYDAGDYYFEQGQYDKALSLANESLAAFAKLKDADEIDIADSHYLAARSLAHMPGQPHYEQANSEFETALKGYEKAEADEDRSAKCMRDAAWNKLKLGQRSEAQELFDKASSHNEDEDEGQNSDTYMNDALK